MSTGSDKYQVGQTVWVVSVNRKASEAVVSRVGRKLVYVEQYRREVAYRISDGVANDDYGHEHLETPGQYESRALRKDLLTRLQVHGFDVKTHAKVDTALLGAVVEHLDSMRIDALRRDAGLDN